MSGKPSKRRKSESVGDAAAVAARGPKTVSALQRLLMAVPFDRLLNFIQFTRLRLTLTRSEKGHWHAAIWMEGTLRYEGSGNDGKATLCDAVAKFLNGERGDYHAFLGAAGEVRPLPAPHASEEG